MRTFATGWAATGLPRMAARHRHHLCRPAVGTSAATRTNHRSYNWPAELALARRNFLKTSLSSRKVFAQRRRQPGALPGGEATSGAKRTAGSARSPPGRAPGGSAELLWLSARAGAQVKRFLCLPHAAPALGEGRERPRGRNRCCVGMRVPREKPFKPGHPHPPKQLRPQFQPVP